MKKKERAQRPSKPERPERIARAGQEIERKPYQQSAQEGGEDRDPELAGSQAYDVSTATPGRAGQ